MKLPVCALSMVRSEPAPIVVRSAAVLFVVLVSPPPETVAVFVTLAGALLATATVSVSGGKLAFAARTSPRVQVSVDNVQPQPVPESVVA